jgi:choline dehydrogenase-like flavoprotein
MALVGRGIPVTMLDGGRELEAERSSALERLRALDPSRWRGDEVSFLKRNVAPDGKGIGVKYAYGSDFPYRDAERLLPMSQKGSDTTASLAVGGYSNVWGATLLPYLAHDTMGWPFPIADLGPHYESVLSFIDSSIEDDDLAGLFPLQGRRGPPLRRSRQAEALLRDLRRHREQLTSEGIAFGASRLAVRAEAEAGRPGCAYCGLCLYGCPYGLIYSSASTLNVLEANPLFRRISGVIVERLAENARGVTVVGRRAMDEARVEYGADRVFLAAGALSSTRILLRSQEAYGHPVILRDSQYFLFPLIRYAGERGVSEEALHTLSQLFLEIRDPEVSPNTVHLQIYTYNDLYADAIAKTLRGAGRWLRPAFGPIVNRMLIAQGYLHSDHSMPIEITLERRSTGGDLLRLDARTERNAEVDAMLNRVIRKFTDNRGRLNALPLGFLLQKTAPGRGYHSGGTFPMRTNPAPFESDVLGRPHGFARIHAVDSSVFPSIPATTITFSVMANAHRIAAQSLDA